MSEDAPALTALDRRVGKLEDDVRPLAAIEAKQHQMANTIHTHAGHLDAILGPKDSLLTQVGKTQGTIRLMEQDISTIKASIASIEGDMAALLDSHEMQKADIAGRWQLRATMSAAILAAVSAVAVAAMQFM